MYRKKISKKGFGTKRIKKSRRKYTMNPGQVIRNDNAVWMKRLHRGPGRSMKHLRGSYRPIIGGVARFIMNGTRKPRRNSHRSEL